MRTGLGFSPCQCVASRWLSLSPLYSPLPSPMAYPEDFPLQHQRGRQQYPQVREPKVLYQMLNMWTIS